MDPKRTAVRDILNITNIKKLLQLPLGAGVQLIDRNTDLHLGSARQVACYRT